LRSLPERGIGGHRHDRDQHTDIEHALPGEEPGHHDHAFTRHEKAEKGLALQHHNEEDDHITPVVEAKDQVVEVLEHRG